MHQKRRYERKKLNQAATLHLLNGRVHDCTIRDFCPGGMLLIWGYPHREARLAQEVAVRIHLVGERDPILFYAQVAHVADGAIGIAFIDPDFDALVSMERLADEYAVRSAELPSTIPTLPPGEQQRVVEALSLCLRERAELLIDDFLGRACMQTPMDELGFLPDQNLLLAGHVATILRREGKVLRQDYLEEISAGFQRALVDKMRLVEERREDRSELSLVEQDSFEQWLVLRGACSRIERDLAPQLQTLHQLLTPICGYILDEDTNPMGPAHLGRIFEQACNGLALDSEVALGIKQGFSRCLQAEYPGMLAIFIERAESLGLKPAPIAVMEHFGPAREVVDEPPPMLTSALGTEQPVSASAEQRDFATEAAAIYGEFSGETFPEQVQMPGGAISDQDGDEQPLEVVTGPQPQSSSAIHQLGELSQRVRDLGASIAYVGNPVQQSFTFPDFQINNLEQAHSLLERLRSVSLSVGGQSDQWRQRIEDILQQPKVRAAVLDHEGDLLLRLIESIERLVSPDAGLHEYQASVDGLLQRLAQAGDQAPQQLLHTVKRLESLADLSRESFAESSHQAMLKAATEASKMRLDRKIDHTLVDLSHQEGLPKALQVFLENHWRAVLTHYFCHSGRDSEEVAIGLEVARSLVSFATGSRAIKPEMLKPMGDHLFQGLAVTPLDEERSKQLVVAILQYLVQSDLEEEETLDDLVFSTREIVNARDPEALPPGDMDTGRWRALLSQVRAIRPGTWLKLLDSGEEASYLRLAGIEDQSGDYVLISDDGKETQVHKEGELVRRMAEFRLEVLDDPESPLSDRLAKNMLGELQTRLAQADAHDAVTGSFSRRKITKMIEECLAESVKHRKGHTLCLFDLDFFQAVNSQYGHETGDVLLKAVVEAVQSGCEVCCHIGRLGSDEFAVLFPEIHAEEGIRYAEGVLNSICSVALSVGEKVLVPTASLGVVSLNAKTRSVDEALAQATDLCRAVKASGGNGIKCYQPGEQDQQYRESLSHFVVHLDEIIRSNKLRLRCQVICPLDERAGLLPQYEVLLGMPEEFGGQEALSTFIRAAEMQGRMRDVDRWVIRNTLQWLREHIGQIEGIDGFSINISGSSFSDSHFARYLVAELKQAEVPMEKLIFEVTETEAIGDLRAVARLMEDVKALGCRFSLDDFGSGLSSFSYLKLLPVDFVKIDGGLVVDLGESLPSQAMVKSIHDVCYFLDKRTVAEYVADEGALDWAKVIGIDYGQGFYLGMPIFLDDLIPD